MKRNGALIEAFGKILAVALGMGFVATLGSCTPQQSAHDDNVMRIVASTNVYGDIARTIAGEDAQVIDLIPDPDRDPHTFEASARSQLFLSKADIILRNGGGYDDFVDILLAGVDNSNAKVIDAFQLKLDQSQTGTATKGSARDEANEHVWFDLPTMQAVAQALAAELVSRDPKHQTSYRANAEAFTSSIAKLEADAAKGATSLRGIKVIVTEALSHYLIQSIGLVNVTPPAFSDAVEEGRDAPPLALHEVLASLESGEVGMLIVNQQTEEHSTELLLAAAKGAGIAVVTLRETLPADMSYLTWMRNNIRKLEQVRH